MTEQRRTASPAVFLAFGLGLLGLVLCVVPWTSAASRNEFVGQGSNAISQRDLSAVPEGTRSPANSPAPGRGVLLPTGKDSHVPKSLRNPWNDNRSGGDTMDWTRMPGFAAKKFTVQVGDADGLFPGQTIDLPVNFVNGQSFDLLVLDAKVTATGSPQCGSSNLVLSDVTFPTPIEVAKKSSIPATVPLGLRSSAPDSCQGVSFTVTVTSTATTA